jgi:DNA-binding transcriptional regulator YiaG
MEGDTLRNGVDFDSSRGKMEEHRLKCDYCKRIIKSEDPKSLPCSACGHGVLRRYVAQNRCDICHEPIWGNVSPPPTKVTCGRCTLGLIGENVKREDTEPPTLGAQIQSLIAIYNQLKERKIGGVLAIEYLEKITEQKFKGSDNERDKIRDFHKKMNAWLRGKFLSGEHLKQLREEMRWSQSLMALRLDCSQQLVGKMEKERNSLNDNAIALLMKQDLWKVGLKLILHHVPPEICSETGIDNKQVTDHRNGKNSVAVTISRPENPKLESYEAASGETPQNCLENPFSK